jgi:hypothetical protein
MDRQNRGDGVSAGLGTIPSKRTAAENGGRRWNGAPFDRSVRHPRRSRGNASRTGAATLAGSLAERRDSGLARRPLLRTTACATTRPFSSAVQRRRRTTPLRTSARPRDLRVCSLVSNIMTLTWPTQGQVTRLTRISAMCGGSTAYVRPTLEQRLSRKPLRRSGADAGICGVATWMKSFLTFRIGPRSRADRSRALAHLTTRPRLADGRPRPIRHGASRRPVLPLRPRQRHV